MVTELWLRILYQYYYLKMKKFRLYTKAIKLNIQSDTSYTQVFPKKLVFPFVLLK